jgi:hypothetical protein
MSKISFSIDSQGNFTGSTSSPVQQGTTVTFTLTTDDAMSTVYIYSGTSLDRDSTLFGAPSVTVPGLYVISAEAVTGREYSLSMSPNLPLPVGVVKGTINVGSGLAKEYIPSLEGMRFPPSSRLRDDGHGHPGAFVPDSSP